jgi:iron complex outermembrane receptor protein
MKLPPEQYTETPLLEIPQSIQVVPEQVIEDQQVQRLDEASRNVNCITPVGPAPRSAFDIFQIRGFDTRNIFRNGLRDDTNVTVGSALTNLERVEVLKEPASVLYSQGSLGGTINIITEKPLSEPFYSLEGTAGSYDFYRGSLDLSGPLNESETLLYRLNASARNSESFIDFVEIDRHFVAPVLTWLISEDTKITFDPSI